MIIKKEPIKKKTKFFSFTKFLYIYFFSSIVFVLFFLTIILQSHTFNKNKIIFLDYFSKAGRFEYLYLPQIVFKALKSNLYKLDKIYLEIPFEETLILENVRKDAILKGELPSAEKMPRVKASILINDKKYRTDIRLKGDRKVHFIDKEKSSYKFELDKNQFIYGVKKFSLQKPRVRNYIHEWIFHQMSNDLDIIKIKYEFLELYINGEDKGLYVLEEGFGKELIERNKRRNGPIFSLDEDVYGLYDDPVFEIYNKRYWAKPENNNLARIASQKLRDFFNNKSKAAEVFDLEKWAAYFAVIDLTSNYHGALLKSVKLYYNPLNGLFEPIPFDGHRHKPNYHKFNVNYDNRILIDIVENPIGDEITGFTWLKKFFYENNKINQNFYEIYASYLNKISSKNYINQFLTKHSETINQINSHIYADYFFYDNIINYGIGIYYYLIDDLEHHAKNIRDKLKSKDQVQLLKINDNQYIFKPYYKNYGNLRTSHFECLLDGKTINISTINRINNFARTRINLSLKNHQNPKCNYLVLEDLFNNSEKKRLKVDFLNSKYSYENFKNKYSKNLNKYFSKSGNKLYLLDDIITIDHNVYIPHDLQVIIKPGQKLYIINNVFIISNSAWLIGGEGPLTLISGKKNNLGGGILIGDTLEKSEIYNTHISFLNGFNLFKNQEYLLLGSLNFHQTKVKLNNVRFTNIFSEDAINIFRSNFNILNVNYDKISSDAIDIDFSHGKIDNAEFLNIKNDALDFSGSEVKVNNATFENINDKIISAGEDSKIYINQIIGKNSYAGIVSKDGSKVYSSDVNFDGVKIPFAVYQKKNEYDYPMLNTKNYVIKNFIVTSIKDPTSNLNIKDDILVVNSDKILPIMYEKKIFLIN